MQEETPKPTIWYDNLEASCATIKHLLKEEARDYSLNRFLRIARRVDEYANSCPHCRESQLQMESLLNEISANIDQLSKDHKRSFIVGMNLVLSHLRKSHKLISDGQNTAAWMAIGTGIGIAIGIILKNPIVGITLGMTLGLIIGIVIDRQARNKGRVI